MEIEGFLKKNHAGSRFGAGVKRYFVTKGFSVHYYSKADKAVVKGHFDLRNVVKLSRMPDYSVDKARPRPEAGRDATAVQRPAGRRPAG